MGYRVRGQQATAGTRAGTVAVPLAGLTVLAVGTALWLFPLLPAVTAAGARPQFAWPPQLGLGLAIAGMAILWIGRRGDAQAERVPTAER